MSSHEGSEIAHSNYEQLVNTTAIYHDNGVADRMQAQEDPKEVERKWGNKPFYGDCRNWGIQNSFNNSQYPKIRRTEF